MKILGKINKIIENMDIVLEFVFIILTAAGVLTVYHIKSQEKIIYIGGYILLLVVFFLYKICIWYKIKKFNESIESALDAILSGDEIDYADTYKDTMDSKMFSKIFKIYESNSLKNQKMIMESKKIHQLISDISHQVKTPIANIKMYNQLLLRIEGNEKTAQYLTVMEQQINKLDFLMQGLIKMSRLENNIIKLKVEKNKVIDLLASSVSGVVIEAEKKDINIMSECAEHIQALFDLKWTSEVLFNLLDNAVKYSESGQKILIKVTEQEEYVKIEVIDNGIGISQEELTSIFKRFYRSEQVHQTDGLGLGLNLARRIVSMEHGYIHVKSEIGKGTDFIVHLPKCE